jgi:hypothetical protein
MIYRFWRLSEAGENNLGLACNDDGLFLGRTPLIERHGDRFVVRERDEIERLLSCAYAGELAADRLMRGLRTVAAALNANDPCLARIAAVHLQIPDLPTRISRDEMEAADILIKTNEIQKASPNDPKHPGWPAGTAGGRGGKFRPKDGSEAVIQQEVIDRIRRIAMRRVLRTGALAVLRLTAEAGADLIPIVGFAADIATLVDIANTISEFRKLKIDADAAIDFIKHGPYTLEELQVASGDAYQQFSSYELFYKLFPESLDKRFGRAGDGTQYHHIVTQGGANEDNIPPQQLQNTENIIRLPTLLHEAVNAEYLMDKPGTNMSLYDWLQTQPYNVQREEGLKILRNLHILK